MSNINGDWFHSRSSSNQSELISVRQLVLESQKLDYVGFSWSAGRSNNPKLFQLANAIGVQPSTMQTKIRTMIRLGFIVDEKTCPIRFTRIGLLWNELFSLHNKTAAEEVYQIILTLSLSTFSFTNDSQGYSLNPNKGELPLKYLFNILINDRISINDLFNLVDGNTNRVGHNFSYWKADLINAGLFRQVENDLLYTGKFAALIQQVKEFVPNALLSDNDWQLIRENPLIDISPFKDEIKKILLELAENKTIHQTHKDVAINSEPLIEIVSDVEEKNIFTDDILSQGTQYVNTNRRVRNAVWSKMVKKAFNFSCVIPLCDVIGQEFVQAAHIKPDAVPENELPHRAHVLNGLCLCYHCHIAFDKGFISLDDNFKVIVSSIFRHRVQDQHLKKVILDSSYNIIKSRTDNRYPILDFVNYHRNNIFIP